VGPPTNSGASAGATATGGAGGGGPATGGSDGVGPGVSGAGAGDFAGSSGAGSPTGGSGGAGVGGAAGRAGGAGSGTGGASAFSAVSGIVTRMCAASNCHGGRRNPNLSAANLYTTLMNTAVRQCGSDRLVTPRDTANSAILELVNGRCGNFIMPDGCDVLPCLEAADMKTISDWISAGAPR